MAGETTIEWTDASWNPTVVKSPGCDNCYAMGLGYRFEHNRPNKPLSDYKGTTGLDRNGRRVCTGKVKRANDRSFSTPQLRAAGRPGPVMSASAVSGKNARSIDPASVHDLIRQCCKQNAAVFFKQWGRREFIPDRDDPPLTGSSDGVSCAIKPPGSSGYEPASHARWHQ
jgi:protein gp37